MQHGGELRHPFLPFTTLQPPAPGGNVLRHGHVGEEGILLEEIPHLPLLGRQVDMPLTVKKHLAVQDNPPPVRPLNTSNTLEGQALAATRGAQQGQGLSLCLKLRF